jgi:hypothetical protein
VPGLNPCVFNNKVGNIVYCSYCFLLEHWDLNRHMFFFFWGGGGELKLVYAKSST